MARPVTKRETLINSALKLFAQKGIHGTTTKDIALSSHTAEGLIYRYFKSKEELALKLFVRCLREFSYFLKAESDKGRNPEEKLRKTIEAFFRFARENPVTYEYVLRGHDELELRELPRAIFMPKDVFVNSIREGIKKKVFRKKDENLAAAMVIGMAIRVQFFIKNKVSRISEKEGIEEVTESALQILKR